MGALLPPLLAQVCSEKRRLQLGAQPSPLCPETESTARAHETVCCRKRRQGRLLQPAQSRVLRQPMQRRLVQRLRRSL
jgi:hypothetical protein